MNAAKKSIACRDCKAGRCGRLYRCVDCGIEACSHTIRPQTPRNSPEAGKVERCASCRRKVFSHR